MSALPLPKLELPSFITSNESESSFKNSNKDKSFWPGVPTSGRETVYEEHEKKFIPPVVSNFDVWSDETVKKTDEISKELHQKALNSGAPEDWDSWKKQKLRLRNAIKTAKLRHDLTSRPIAECMLPFYCDSCDRGFNSNDEYEAHVKEHITCGKDGCPFIGHPKIVQLHQKMQHMTGLASKIMNLKSKEDVENWRKERKKKFPTAENIAKKFSSRSESEIRGNVLRTKEFGKMKKNQRRDNSRKGQKFKNKKNNFAEDLVDDKEIPVDRSPEQLSNIESQEKNKNVENSKKESSNASKNIEIDRSEVKKEDITIIDHSIKSISPSDTKSCEQSPKCNDKERKQSDPMAILLENDSDECPVEAPIFRSAQKNKPNVPKVGGALGSLMSSYDISSDDEEEEIPQKAIAETVPVRRNDKKANSRKRSVLSEKAWNPHTDVPQKKKSRSSLLEKLLAKDIRHERNIMLQCIHYIVRNNFFDIGKR